MHLLYLMYYMPTLFFWGGGGVWKMSTSLELVSLAGDVADSISYQLSIYGVF